MDDEWEDATTATLIAECLAMGYVIEIERWCGVASCTVVDEFFDKKGCAQLRGESFGGTAEPYGYPTDEDVDQALRSALLMAVRHEHPADPDYVAPKPPTFPENTTGRELRGEVNRLTVLACVISLIVVAALVLVTR